MSKEVSQKAKKDEHFKKVHKKERYNDAAHGFAGVDRKSKKIRTAQTEGANRYYEKVCRETRKR